ncbi:hypothetical protein GOM49_15545 [Clostridium bovifaecis]|uniref:YhhN-like protein n=1 Tax=Clostridium bovifaecis TaxID=2184719 RepID=A0A6I6F1C4_9CLOT|nr:hypothetical protein GOM49_15545 [Clostridium bovifaecis]
MVKYLHKKHFIIFLLLSITLLMYFVFITLDILNKSTGSYYSIILKYGSIIIFFFASILINNSDDSMNILFLRAALFFTLCADTCLLILGYYKLGVCFFIVVQTIYIIRHSYLSKINKKLLLIPACIIFILPILLSQLKPHEIDASLFNLGTIYGILLITSVLVAQKNSKIIAWGMIFFFLCDINVALSYVYETYPIAILNISLEYLFNFLVWTFYLPSQLLLTLSGIEEGIIL